MEMKLAKHVCKMSINMSRMQLTIDNTSSHVTLQNVRPIYRELEFPKTLCFDLSVFRSMNIFKVFLFFFFKNPKHSKHLNDNSNSQGIQAKKRQICLTCRVLAIQL